MVSEWHMVSLSTLPSLHLSRADVEGLIANMQLRHNLSTCHSAEEILALNGWSEERANDHLLHSIKTMSDQYFGGRLQKWQAIRALEKSSFDPGDALVLIRQQVFAFSDAIDISVQAATDQVVAGNFDSHAAVKTWKAYAQATLVESLDLDENLAEYICREAKWNISRAIDMHKKMKAEEEQVEDDCTPTVRCLCLLCEHPITLFGEWERGILKCPDKTCQESHSDVCKKCVLQITTRRRVTEDGETIEPTCPYCRKRLITHF